MTKNTLITSRPGIGKTQKAIEYYIDKISSGVNGVFVTLEMSDVILMDRILKTCVDKNIILSKNSIKNLYDTCLDFNAILNTIKTIDEPIQFVIIDYLQLVDNSETIDIQMDNFFNFCQANTIDVILLSQLNRNVKDNDASWTNAVLGLRDADSYFPFLKYMSDGYFLTKAYGEIY
jgi:replicative DNA helicase